MELNKNKFKGTKGPWKISGSGHPDFNWCVTAPDGGSICHVTKWPNTELRDTYLISAAPEMLDVVLELKEKFLSDEWRITLKDGSGNQDIYDHGQKMLKAINKALGHGE